MYVLFAITVCLLPILTFISIISLSFYTYNTLQKRLVVYLAKKDDSEKDFFTFMLKGIYCCSCRKYLMTLMLKGTNYLSCHTWPDASHAKRH